MTQYQDFFQEVAYSLGYMPQDLLPPDRVRIQMASETYTKKMSNKQKQFYINKKYDGEVRKQEKINEEVENQMKKRSSNIFRGNSNKKVVKNIALKKVLDQHEKQVSKQQRFLQTRERKEMIEKEKSEVRRLKAQKLGMTSQGFGSNTSMVSKRSNKTQQSKRSLASRVSTESNKERLRLVRERQKQEQKFRKHRQQLKKQSDSQKSFKSSLQTMRKSQRVKTRSQISKKIVQQNKKQINFIKNTQIKDHLENLKFKIQRTQVIRSNNIKKRDFSFQKNDQYSQIKKMQDEQNQKIRKFRYDEKMRNIQNRTQNRNFMNDQARYHNRVTEEMKNRNVKQRRQLRQYEKNSFLKSIDQGQKKKLLIASVNRYQARSMQSKKIQNTIKHEFARKNLESITQKRQLEADAKKNKMNRRIQDLKHVDNMKQVLLKERKKMNRTFYEKKSVSIRNYQPKFNSFFDS